MTMNASIPKIGNGRFRTKGMFSGSPRRRSRPSGGTFARFRWLVLIRITFNARYIKLFPRKPERHEQISKNKTGNDDKEHDVQIGVIFRLFFHIQKKGGREITLAPAC